MSSALVRLPTMSFVYCVRDWSCVADDEKNDARPFTGVPYSYASTASVDTWRRSPATATFVRSRVAPRAMAACWAVCMFCTAVS